MKSSIKIGRNSDNDVVIDDLNVSRNHAIISVVGNGNFEINDLGSTNGTFVNGSRITQKIIREGDKVEVAGSFVNWFAAFVNPQKKQQSYIIQENPFDKILKTISVGSSLENDVVMSDNLVSDKHATISLLNDGNYFIQDLGSSSGTFVNGIKVQSKNFTISDIVRIASSDLPQNWVDNVNLKRSFFSENRKTILIGLPALTIIIISIFVLLSLNNKPSREKAKELIINKYGLPQPETTMIYKKYFKSSKYVNYCSFPMVCIYPQGRRTYSDNEKVLTELKGKGVITINDIVEQKWAYDEDETDAILSLTDEGKKYLIKEDDVKYTVKTCDLEFGEITDINTQKQQKRATARYTIIKKNITPFRSGVSQVPENRTASFSLFDDGWRIE